MAGGGEALFKLGTSANKNGTLQGYVRLTRVDIMRYEKFFHDRSIFGDMASCKFNGPVVQNLGTGEIDLDPQGMLEPKVPFGTATEIVNLSALKQRRSRGPEATG